MGYLLEFGTQLFAEMGCKKKGVKHDSYVFDLSVWVKDGATI